MKLPLLFAGALLLRSSLGAALLHTSGKNEPMVQTNTPDDNPKYFHEPGGDNQLGHYDIRYYTGKAVTYEERGVTLQHMVRSYLTTFREKKVETWIAHGTLLGWWWNGKIMPWDWDLDVQVSATTLSYLGTNLNMTLHNYTGTAEDGTPIHRQYLLDVNPYAAHRIRGKGMNVIDARWIDTSNGLFIDITGLSETEPETQPGVWTCKNYHHYRTRELYPLRETIFEGVAALVPYSFDKILTQEYSGQALTSTLHEGHQWLPEQKEWVKMPDQKVMKNKAPGNDKPHVPRSLASRRGAGLVNLFRIL